MSSPPPLILLLSDDLLLKILSFLPDAADRKSLRATCKPFLHLDSLHRTHLRPEFLPSLLLTLRRLTSLDLSVCPRLDAAAIAQIFPSTRRLTRLNLSGCSALRSPNLEPLIANCPNLESVDLSYCTAIGDSEAAALSAAPLLRRTRAISRFILKISRSTWTSRRLLPLRLEHLYRRPAAASTMVDGPFLNFHCSPPPLSLATTISRCPLPCGVEEEEEA